MINHRFLDGTIHHKRYLPKEHNFKYKFFMLDISIKDFKTLNKNLLFSYNKFNLFSFYSKDHFGNSNDFLENISIVCEKFNIEKMSNMRFITLPRISGFVFNPISVLLFLKNNIPVFMFAEVHNYNGGRVLYPVELAKVKNNLYGGSTKKDMYVSPFFKREGDYKFDLVYGEDGFQLKINLFEDDKKVLISNLIMKSKEFSKASIFQLFFKHTFLTFWVVTRTLYQSFRLKLKGLKWTNPIPQDKVRRI